jgi:RNA polymerase-binding transcription factor DksA
MADDADIASSFIDRAVADALSKMQQNIESTVGSKICMECGEDIPDMRCKMGFRVCIECAEENERRGSLFAK